MLIKLFRDISDIRWLSSLLVVILLFVPFRFVTEQHHYSNSFLQYFDFFAQMDYKSSLAFIITSVLIVVFLLFVFNHSLIINKLIPLKNYSGVLFSVVFLVVWKPVFASFSDIFTTSLLLVSVYNLFRAENSEKDVLRYYDSAFIISVAIIFNIYLFPFIILPVIAQLLFRQINPKIIVSTLTGFLLPHIFLTAFYFAIHNTFPYGKMLSDFFSSIQISFDVFLDYPVHWICFTPILILVLFRALNRLPDKKISIRKKTLLLFWVLVLSVILLALKNVPLDLMLLIIAFPLGFFIADSFYDLFSKRVFRILADIGFVVLVFYNMFFA